MYQQLSGIKKDSALIYTQESKERRMALLPTVPFSSGLYEIRKEKNMKVVKCMPLTIYSLSQRKNKINFF